MEAYVVAVKIPELATPVSIAHYRYQGSDTLSEQVAVIKAAFAFTKPCPDQDADALAHQIARVDAAYVFAQQQSAYEIAIAPYNARPHIIAAAQGRSRYHV